MSEDEHGQNVFWFDPNLPQQTEPIEDRAAFLRSKVIPLSEAIDDYEPIEWLIDGLIPKGSLTLFAGEPKKGRKSLVSMHIGLCVSLGLETLTRSCQQGEVLIANLEDGYKRMIRRFHDFGVRKGNQHTQLYLPKEEVNIDYIEEYIRVCRPALVIIDPMVELELQSDVLDENSAAQIARMFKRLRRLAQETGTAIIIVHHFNKAGDVRGSSAIKGSIDGWIDFIARGEDPHLLRWTMRDSPDLEIEVRIRYENEEVSVQPASEIRRVVVDSTKRNGKRKQTNDACDGWTPRKSEVGEKVRRLLERTETPLSQNEICRIVGAHKGTVKSVLDQFASDGVVRATDDGWVFVPALKDL